MNNAILFDRNTLTHNTMDNDKVYVCMCVTNAVYQRPSSSTETKEQEIKSFDRKYSRERFVRRFIIFPNNPFFALFEYTCPIMECLLVEDSMKTSLIKGNYSAYITCMKTIKLLFSITDES